MTADVRRTALVTGASRGIGRAAAIALARQGIDVALAARTIGPGERREHSPTVSGSDDSLLPGSLRETAAAVESFGVEALVVPMDLVDLTSVDEAFDVTLAHWGRLDVLVNNGRFVGPGDLDRMLDVPIPVVEQHMRANFLAPLRLVQRFIASMAGRGQVRIIQVSSSTGQRDPDVPVGQGSWSIAYGASKAAFHRIVGFILVEAASEDVLAFNVLPGFTASERLMRNIDRYGFEPDQYWAPTDVCGSVIAWLASSDDASELHGQAIDSQAFYREHFRDSELT